METVKKIDLSTISEEQFTAIKKQLELRNKEKKINRIKNKQAFESMQADFVYKHIDKLIAFREAIENIINDLFKDYQVIAELKSELYNIKNQASHTVNIDDGQMCIKIGYNETIGYNGNESAGLEKIKEFITGLSDESEKTKKLELIINSLLKPNVDGQLNPVKVAELNKMRNDFNDDFFNEAMDIVMFAQIKQRTSMYVRGWKFVKNENGIDKRVEFSFSI